MTSDFSCHCLTQCSVHQSTHLHILFPMSKLSISNELSNNHFLSIRFWDVVLFFKVDTRREVSENEISKSWKSYSSNLLSSNKTTWFVRKIRYLITSLYTDHSGQSGKPEINPIDSKDKKRRVCSSCLFLHQCKSLGLWYSGCIF